MFLKSQPDESWTIIGYLDSNDFRLSITTQSILIALENERNEYLDREGMGDYFVILDNVYFMKYYENQADTINDNYCLYLVSDGLLRNENSVKTSTIKLAYSGVQVYRNEIYLNTRSLGVSVTHTCTGAPCSSCEFTYTWTWLIFHGRINGCDCTQQSCEECKCNHAMSTIGSISIL